MLIYIYIHIFYQLNSNMSTSKEQFKQGIEQSIISMFKNILEYKQNAKTTQVGGAAGAEGGAGAGAGGGGAGGGGAGAGGGGGSITAVFEDIEIYNNNNRPQVVNGKITGITGFDISFKLHDMSTAE